MTKDTDVIGDHFMLSVVQNGNGFSDDLLIISLLL